MKPSAPKKIVWIIALIVGILGIVSHFVSIKYVTDISNWLLIAGFALLALGTTFKGI